MKNIAIIPARSGSKGLKDKNIKLLDGKPLMAYTIEAALKSGVFADVMVSTDSEIYADIAKKLGASVPFLRSEETATDKASSWDMAEEVMSGYAGIGKYYDTFCLLQPTSPLRTSNHIKEAYDLFYEKASVAVVSVCEAEHSPLWCGQLPESHEMDGFIQMDNMKQRQAGGKFYRLNGAIYIVDYAKFKENRYLYREGSFAYVMDQYASVDIDNEMDFKFAEMLVKSQQLR